MYIRKKFIVVVSGLFLLSSLVSCSNDKINESKSNVSVTATTVEESKINDNNIVRQEKIDMKKYQLEYDKEQDKLEKERIAKEEAEKKVQEDAKAKEQEIAKNNSQNNASASGNGGAQNQVTQGTPVSNLKAAQNSEQLIVITKTSASAYSALCNVYEKNNSEWKYVLKDVRAVTGLNGISYNRREGDRTTPAGIFTISQAFGKANNPGTSLPYRVVQGDDWWAGDSEHPETYNTWQKSPSTGWRESESERLIDYEIYKYAFVIDFNTQRTPYKGSAMFFHVAPYSGGGTYGCVGVGEGDLVKILKWINPSKNPKIIICRDGELGNF
ncbi:L,D-transpeptidase family protein [Clostridium sp. UBA1652]|uniref:L,D-transpeptidase family protein n=1 Tax=Clostridium sp. UBA1652 TaxID=1946348 RepID=UPI00257D2477|nr:L,D-transpeptidase family protein [Clostridium sp. UBA1652]